jgi:hypothetical protein
MFITRPTLPQIDLDLVEVRGGGSVPSQFWGRTADGSPVYIRYRGATLSISKGPPGGEEDSPDMELLLQETIGPPLHGVILLEQICDLTGVTVRGKRLTLTEDAWRKARQDDWIIDFSGRRTFWERHTRSTLEGTLEFERRLRDSFHSLTTVTFGKSGPEFGSVSRDDLYGGLFGIDCDHARLEELLAVRSLQPLVSEAFALAIQFSASWKFGGGDSKQTPQARAVSGFRRTLADDLGWTPELAPSLTGSLRAEFLTESKRSRELLDTVIEVMESCFANKVSRFDLATGELIDTVAFESWQSEDLRAWCAASPTRYLSISRGLGRDDPSRRRERWVGTRPA